MPCGVMPSSLSVVEPAPPFRARPLVPRPPQLVGAIENVEQRGIDLEERRALDQLLPKIGHLGLKRPHLVDRRFLAAVVLHVRSGCGSGS